MQPWSRREGWSRREVLKLGVLATTAAASPRWVKASTDSNVARNVALNRAAWASSAADVLNTGHMATDGRLSTKWQSADADQQWIYVDLGAPCAIHSVVLRWGANHALAHTVQVSMDAGPSPETGLVENWKDLHQTLDGKGGVEQVQFPETQARFVRLLLSEKAKPGGYELASFEVLGTGGFEAAPIPLPAPEADGSLRLAGGWRLIDQSAIADKAAVISTLGFDDSQWLIATVPGTILTSYLNLGAIPDPYYGDQDLQISDFFCHTNWWYRNELEVPATFSGRRIWLNFAGINYRAYIYVNGRSAGAIDGAFVRGRFDVTDLVTPGKKNCIAVLILPVPKPDRMVPKPLDGYVYPQIFPQNEPTILEADSWDWLPTIHDRDTGIINHVTLTATGDVTIADPFASTHFADLKDLTHADVTLRLNLTNHATHACKGELKVQLGEIVFTHPVTLDAGETREVKLDKSSYKQLALINPKLWWPNGHGEQNLYDLTLTFTCGGSVSDVNKSRIGIREFTYNQPSLTRWNVAQLLNGLDIAEVQKKATSDPLTFICNGKPIFARGADWGMDEGMLRCDREGFERRLRFEKEMNYNLLRNCAGNVDKREFFELCDEYGLMVWEEFGISSDTMPDDPVMWLASARDRFLRRRNHACIALWCTANETIPREPLIHEMPRLAEELDNTRIFLHSSIQVPPTDGDSPYDTRKPSYYFRDLARGFRTELGSPTIPSVESMRRMMPWNKLWPVSEVWGDHDWWLQHNWGNEGLCDATERAIAAYGAPSSIEDCCRKAQMVNMEVFKAIYEGWNHRMWSDCTGVMIWMSNPAWPSLTWNTYDYYMEPTAAYFAIRSACQPIHIQWNAANNEVKTINCTSTDLKGLAAHATIYNLDGSAFQSKSVSVDCAANSAQLCMTLFAAGANLNGLSEVHFIQLVLEDAAGATLSTNFYWRAKAEWNYDSLAAMKQANLKVTAGDIKDGKITVSLGNDSAGVALMVRVKAVDQVTGLLAAPVLYSDNYISLVPQESRHIEVDLSFAPRSGKIKLIAEGWNLPPLEIGTLNVKG